MNRNLSAISYTLSASAFTIFIVVMSSLPSGTLPGNGSAAEQVLSNLAHIPAFALVTFLWLMAFQKRLDAAGSRVLYICIITGLLLFGVLDEFHQSFVPGRFASVMDFILDVLGILAGTAFYAFLKKSRRTKQETGAL